GAPARPSRAATADTSALRGPARDTAGSQGPMRGTAGPTGPAGGVAGLVGPAGGVAGPMGPAGGMADPGGAGRGAAGPAGLGGAAARRRAPATVADGPPRPRPDDPRLRPQREALKIALQAPALAGPVYDEMPADAFTEPAYLAMHKAILAAGGTTAGGSGPEW